MYTSNGVASKVLRGLRGKEELTQAEFAERIGILQYHVSEMETGNPMARFDKVFTWKD
jgi:transcriptional regulator with XRE-family HTH domain